MECLDNLNWFKNRRGLEVTVPPRLLFCHIPKTGGMSVYYALLGAITTLSILLQKATPTNQPYVCTRIDSYDRMPLIDQSWFVASHLPYGWHYAFKSGNQFKPFTLVRDPFERVVSAFTYQCMRNGTRPESSGFIDFACRLENQNVMTRYFTGGELNHEPDVRIAISILARDFLAYDTINSISKLIEGLINYANLPNVMMQKKMNFTVDGYKLDASGFRDEVEALNRADLELYRHVKLSPRRLEIPIEDKSNFFSVLIQESGGAEETLAMFQPILTSELLDTISSSSTADEVFKKYINLKA